jgi:hypothetical protein
VSALVRGVACAGVLVRPAHPADERVDEHDAQSEEHEDLEHGHDHVDETVEDDASEGDGHEHESRMDLLDTLEHLLEPPPQGENELLGTALQVFGHGAPCSFRVSDGC